MIGKIYLPMLVTKCLSNDATLGKKVPFPTDYPGMSPCRMDRGGAGQYAVKCS